MRVTYDLNREPTFTWPNAANREADAMLRRAKFLEESLRAADDHPEGAVAEYAGPRTKAWRVELEDLRARLYGRKP